MVFISPGEANSRKPYNGRGIEVPARLRRR